MKIPPELHDIILGEAAAGRTQRDIAKLIKSQHGISVTHVAIGNLIRTHRAGRAEIARAALVDYAATKLPVDLAHADSQYDRLSRLLDVAIGEAEKELSTFAVERVYKLSKVVRDATEERRKALGLNQDSPQITTLFELLSDEGDDDAGDNEEAAH